MTNPMMMMLTASPGKTNIMYVLLQDTANPPNKTNPEDDDDDDNDSTVVCNNRYYDNKDFNVDDTASCNFVHQD